MVQHGVQCQQRVERELQWQLQQQQQDEPGRGHSRPGDDMPLVALKNQFSYADILQAYLDCRKRKRSKSVAVAFEVNQERNLMRQIGRAHV